MVTFDRFDICEAHYLFARHYHVGGDTDGAHGGGYFARLNRLQFTPGHSLRAYDDPDKALTPNGAAIYRQLVSRYEAGYRYLSERAAPWPGYPRGPGRYWPGEIVSIGRDILRGSR